MDMKYEFLQGDTIDAYGRTLHRIRALADFGDVKDGETGGYVEGRRNLSCDGNAWVGGNAWVYGDAQVSGNARVSGDARVYGDAWVYGDTRVYGDAQVSGNAWVYGDAQVSGNARVSGDARVYGDAWVYGDTWVCGGARVGGKGDILQITGLGSMYRTTTIYKTTDSIRIVCGCFTGGIKQFEDQVNKTRTGKIKKEYLELVELMRIHFEIKRGGER